MKIRSSSEYCDLFFFNSKKDESRTSSAGSDSTVTSVIWTRSDGLQLTNSLNTPKIKSSSILTSVKQTRPACRELIMTLKLLSVIASALHLPIKLGHYVAWLS